MSQDQKPVEAFLPKTATFVRYVVYSPRLGVAHEATPGEWAFSGEKPAHLYPTFPQSQGDVVLRMVKEGRPDVTDLKLMQCLPKKGLDATPDDLTANMIPPPRKV